MANAGIKGSQAGTTLRGAISRLSKPTDDMRDAMEELGISFYDSNGKMKSLSEQVGMLEGAFSGMTDEQKNNYLVTLYGQEALSVTSEKIQERSRREEVPALEIQGETYQLKELSSRPFSTGSGLHGTGFLVVLPDEAAETFPVYHTCYVFETKKEIPANEGMELSQWLSDNGAYDVSGDYRKNAVDEFMVASDTRASQNSVFVTFAFSLFYVGLIFACCAAAILAVQQLSDGVSYKHKYEILSYLGADEGKMQGLVLKQMIFYFFIPVAIPIPVSIFLASQINQVLLADLITVKAFCMAIAISIGLFFLVYFIYFLATYLGYRKRVLE